MPAPEAPVRAERVRVGLLGEFGVHNFGNEASLAAVLDVLRPDDRLVPVVVADRCEAVTAEHGAAAVPLHHPGGRRGGAGGLLGKLADARHAWRTVGGLDAVVVPGTGIFEGLAIAPGGIPLTLFWYALAARLRRRPFLVLSVGVDAAFHPLTARLFRWTLAAATVATVRDEGSADAARRLGVRRDLDVVPDLVLGLPDPGTPRRERPRVVVGVIDYRGLGTAEGPADRAAYVARTVRVVDRLAGSGADVVVVGGALPDAPTVREVAARAASAGPRRVEAVEAESLADVSRATAGSWAVVAARYHHLVTAVRLGVPAVSLGYGAKQGWLLEQFGQGDRVHTVDGFDPEEVADQVLALLREPPPDTRPARAEAARRLAAQEDRLREVLASTVRTSTVRTSTVRTSTVRTSTTRGTTVPGAAAVPPEREAAR
ncbi:polysaccharide pyruvyl transferase family protein [Isoptericola sp. NPDC019693]|uniref:polysaccharide pyruvyl transferase family protein n=1 Tax=Isoptericola sp. NPDC019693 TaxID=3364009 RepID=UPI0037BCCAE7